MSGTISIDRDVASEIVEALISHPDAYGFLYLIDDLREAIDGAEEKGEEARIVWHKFPEETPPEGVRLLVTWEGESNTFAVTGGIWKFDKFTGGTFQHAYDWLATPIAWTELPEPYRPE